MTTYYTVSGAPSSHSYGGSAYIRGEFTLIASGFATVNTEMTAKGNKAGETWTGTHSWSGANISTAFGWGGVTMQLPGLSPGTYLKNDGSWGAPAGSGDMILAAIQSVTGAKTFAVGTFKIAGATSGAVNFAVPAVAGAGTVTFPAVGTLATLDQGNSYTKTQVAPPVALSVVANAVAVDLSLGNNFSLTLQATTAQTLSNPTNAVAGTSGQIGITQNATPSTMAFASNWKPFDGTTPPVSTTANAKNLLSYYVVDATTIFYSLAKNGIA